jgi:hypothetical protein
VTIVIIIIVSKVTAVISTELTIAFFSAAGMRTVASASTVTADTIAIAIAMTMTMTMTMTVLSVNVASLLAAGEYAALAGVY